MSNVAVTEIDVEFPAGGGQPIVKQDPEATIEGHYVTWRITSAFDPIKRVKIVFDGGEEFFPGRAPFNEQEQVFPAYAAGISHHMIWGQAPEGLPNPRTEGNNLKPGECVSCKYTIYGLDDKGGPLSEVPPLDPNIIISKP